MAVIDMMLATVIEYHLQVVRSNMYRSRWESDFIAKTPMDIEYIPMDLYSDLVCSAVDSTR